MAKLQGANLREANFDFSVLPLHCGSFGMIVDDRFIAQLICHLTRLNIKNCSKKYKNFINSIDLDLKNSFCSHRVDVEEIS